MNDHPFRQLPLLFLAASLAFGQDAAAQVQVSPAPPPHPTRSLPLAVPPGSFLGGIPTAPNGLSKLFGKRFGILNAKLLKLCFRQSLSCRTAPFSDMQEPIFVIFGN